MRLLQPVETADGSANFAFEALAIFNGDSDDDDDEVAAAVATEDRVFIVSMNFVPSTAKID